MEYLKKKRHTASHHSFWSKAKSLNNVDAQFANCCWTTRRDCFFFSLQQMAKETWKGNGGKTKKVKRTCLYVHYRDPTGSVFRVNDGAMEKETQREQKVLSWSTVFSGFVLPFYVSRIRDKVNKKLATRRFDNNTAHCLSRYADNSSEKKRVVRKNTKRKKKKRTPTS